MTPAATPPTPLQPSNSKQSNGALALTVPPELVEAIAARVAELVTDRTVAAGPAPESRGRMALTKAEAAEALGISVDHLERHVLPDLRVVRSGRLRLVPVAELERWVAENAGRALEGPR